MPEDSSNSGGKIRFRASATYGTPPGRRRGLGIRWVLALVILGIFAWALRGHIGNLVFARGGSSSRPTGEWVGQMEITGEYDPVAHKYAVEGNQHARALVYMKLEGTDSFMNQYGGSGELAFQDDSTRRTLHVGAFGLEDNGRIGGAFNVPGLTDTANGTFTPNEMRIGNKGIPGVNFSAVFQRGTHSKFEQMVSNFH